MGVGQRPDELQRVIERRVTEGRAVSPAALEQAVMRLVDEAGAEEDELRQAVAIGSANIDAGHFTTVATLLLHSARDHGLEAAGRCGIDRDGDDGTR